MSLSKEHKIETNETYWLVDRRWAIYKDDGTVYDTEHGADIPADIFMLRDKLIKSLVDKKLILEV